MININKLIILLHILVFITGNILLSKLIVPIGLLLLNTLAVIRSIKQRKSKTGNALGIIASFIFILLHKEVVDPDIIPVIIAINIAWLIYPVSIIFLMLQLRKERKELERIRRARIEKRKRIKELEARARLQYKAYQRKRLKQKKEERLRAEQRAFEQLVKQAMYWVKEGYIFSVDTNILLGENSLQFIHYLLKNEQISLNVSFVVLNELDNNKNKPGKKGATAREAIRLIERFQEKGQIHLVKIPNKRFLYEHSLSLIPDDRIIGGYLAERINNGVKIMFLCNDRSLRVKARSLGLKVYDYIDKKYATNVYVKV